MRKKLLCALMGAMPMLMASAFAVTIDLDLLGGGLSVLDGLFLIGVGLVLLGILVLCIAFFKPVKQDEEEEEDVSQFLDAIVPEEEVEEPFAEDETDFAEEETSESAEEIPEEDAEAEEELEEELQISEAEEEPEKEQEEEKVYPTLTFTGLNNGEFKILPLKELVTLGRRLENDLIFSDTTISGIHCEITVEEDKIYLADRDSTNGTFLNGIRITEKTEIHKGDILALGQMELRIGI